MNQIARVPNVEKPSVSSWDLSTLDAVEWLARMPPESADLVVTDYAYESMEKHRKVGTTTRLTHSKASSNDWFEIFPNARLPELLEQLYRVLKWDTHLYMNCDQETMFILKPIAEEVGFRFWKPIVWDKMKIGMGYHYRCRYELILFFEKGKRKLNHLGIPDVLEIPELALEEYSGPDILKIDRIRNGYPTEKPVALNEVLIRQSSEHGELVLDPFFGSGSCGVASLKNGRSFKGTDICEEAKSVAKVRLEREIQSATL